MSIKIQKMMKAFQKQWIKAAWNLLLCAYLLVLYSVFISRYVFSYNYIPEITIPNNLIALVTTVFGVTVFYDLFINLHFRLNRIDVGIGVLTIVPFLFIATGHKHFNLDNEYFVCSWMMGMTYFSFRSIAAKLLTSAIPFALSIFFVYELVIGISQAVESLSSEKLSLLVTGSLGNSGIYSCYLVIHLPILYYIIQKNLTTKFHFILKFLFTGAVISVLFVTQSRTSILALAVWLSFHFSQKENFNYLKRFSRPVGITLVIVVALLALIPLFTAIKPASLFGRLAIWKICVLNLDEYFARGIGLGNFPTYYPQWQADYVASVKNLATPTFLNLDESFIANNEFLQLFVELGIVGLAVFGILLFQILRSKEEKQQGYCRCIKETLLLILLCGLTSYPLHSNALFFLFAYGIASLSSVGIPPILQHNKMASFQTKFLLLPIVVVLVLVLTKIITHTKAVNDWQSLSKNPLTNYSDTRDHYRRLATTLRQNGKFMLQWGEKALEGGDFSLAAKILEESKLSYYSYRTLMSTGAAHYNNNSYSRALFNFTQASNLIPNRFCPRYNLMKLYNELGDSTRAKEVARYILSMPMKKKSSDVILIKQEAYKCLGDTN